MKLACIIQPSQGKYIFWQDYNTLKEGRIYWPVIDTSHYFRVYLK